MHNTENEGAAVFRVKTGITPPKSTDLMSMRSFHNMSCSLFFLGLKSTLSSDDVMNEKCFTDDCSRVKLSAIDDEPGTDYINANFIPVSMDACCFLVEETYSS